MHDFDPYNPKLTPEQIEENKRRSAEIESIFKAALKNKAGARLIEFLKQTYLDKPIYTQGMSFEVTTFRQGRADIVQQMIAEVNR